MPRYFLFILSFLNLIMSPFLQADWNFSSNTTMVDETLLFSKDVNAGYGQLLFHPKKVLSVKMADDSATFVEGADYRVDRELGRIVLTEKTSIKSHVLYGDVSNHGQWKDSEGRHILWGEGDLMHRLQLKVTYTHSGKEWDGKSFLPEPGAEKLAKTLLKLKEGRPLNVALVGDSITVGYNASRFVDAPPHQPAWGELVLEGLQRNSDSEIHFNKIAIAGKTVGWGLQKAEQVGEHKPDLLIIAFGMNDAGRRGDHHDRSQKYKESIAKLISQVRGESDAEVILVANMLPNSEFKPHEGHFENRERLRELQKELDFVTLADVMSVTEEILKRKTFADISGNHLNHPNDWLHCLYAEVVLGVMGIGKG
jgi:lysophospholipase L1-like esterase